MNREISGQTSDRQEIAELLDNWILWSDAGDWQRFRTVWHEDGRMMATWFQGSGDEFTEARRGAWEANIGILHFHGGNLILDLILVFEK